jgi:hypothetical protein
MPRNRSKHRSARWLAVLLASVLLHGIVLDLAAGKIGIPAPAPQALPDNVVSVQLQLRQTAQPVPAPVPDSALDAVSAWAAVTALVPKPKPRLTPSPVPAPQPVMRDPSGPVIAESPEPETVPPADEMAGMAAPGSSREPAIVLAPGDVPAVPSAPDARSGNAALAQQPQNQPNPPPSALLKYEVESTKDGKAVYGSGKIAWHTDGNAYAVIGEASVLFFTVLEFRSEGEFDSFGVAPLLYTEKRLRKPATNTHFQREPKIVSFSASTVTYPRQGGEQDRASIIWQLAALGRGNGSLFAPGVGLDVVVAGVRDADTWNIRVIGLESIRIPAGEMQAWHLARQPRAASYDQKIDIWLAPQQQWYPVRLRYTDKNGDYLDMAASAIEPLAPPPVREY